MKPCLGEMFSHHASAESTLPPSGYLAPIVCWLILQELLHFHFLEGELAQSVSGQLKRTAKGTWGRTRSSVEVSSSGVIVVDWHSNWKIIENRSISSQAPWCCGHVRDKFFPNSFDAAASVKEAQLFTTGHFRRGGGAVWGRQGWRGRGEDGRCNTTVVRAEWSDMSSGVWQFLSAPSVRLSITRRLKKKKKKKNCPKARCQVNKRVEQASGMLLCLWGGAGVVVASNIASVWIKAGCVPAARGSGIILGIRSLAVTSQLGHYCSSSSVTNTHTFGQSGPGTFILIC